MANDFSFDANCVGWYRFESAALATDSKGLNDLSNDGVVADTTNFKEGAGSGDWEYNDRDGMTRADADLTAAFPLKSGTTNYTFSYTFWFRPETASASYYYMPWSKDLTAWAGGHCVIVQASQVSLKLTFASGTKTATQAGITITPGQWYFCAVGYDESTGVMSLYVWDDTASSAIVDKTGTYGPGTYGYPVLSTGPFSIGTNDVDNTFARPWDGNIDEFVVFNDILTSDERDLIRQGLYAASSSSSQSSSSSNSSSSSSSDSSSSSFVPRSWPTLTKGIEFDTQEIPGGHDITMPLGNGRTKTRPRYTRRPHRWRIKLRLLTLADYLTLETFYLVDCRRSKYTFEFVEQGVSQTWLVRFDPDEPPQFTTMAEQPNKHAFEAVLLEDTVGTYGAGGYGAQYYDD